MKLCLAVTSDKYELPIAIEDTAVGLARKMGTSEAKLLSSISKGSNGKTRKIKFIRIEID